MASLTLLGKRDRTWRHRARAFRREATRRIARWWFRINGWMDCGEMVARDLMAVDLLGARIMNVRAVKQRSNGIRVRTLPRTSTGDPVCGTASDGLRLIEFEAFVPGAKLVKRDKPAQTDG